MVGKNNPNYKHGGKGTRLYRIWKEMKTRCYNKKRAGYKNYGGRGIRVCEEWRNSFVVFYDDMSKAYRASIKKFGERNISIDRINNNGNYEPTNCRWATREEQMFNSRNARPITFLGQTLSMSAWAKKYNIPITTFWEQLRLGKDISIIINERQYDNTIYVSGPEDSVEGAVQKA